MKPVLLSFISSNTFTGEAGKYVKHNGVRQGACRIEQKLEELQEFLTVTGHLSPGLRKSMHESIGIFLDKTQAVVEMAYRKNSNFKSLEKISNEILNEINKLILLKGELHSLSSIETKDDCSFHACLRYVRGYG